MATKNRHNKIPKLISKRSSQSINRNKKKRRRKAEEGRGGAKWYTPKRSRHGALLIRCVNNSQASTLWCFAGKGTRTTTTTTPTPKSVMMMGRRTEPLSPDSVIHSDGSMASLTHIPDCLSGTGRHPDPATRIRDAASRIRGSRG